MRQRVRTGLVIGLGVLFALWTWLTLDGHLPAWVDASQNRIHLQPGSAAEQDWAAIAIDTQPFVVTIALAILAYWSWQRRLRRVGWAIVIGVLLAWPGNTLLKDLFQRVRPPSNSTDQLLQHGWSYPSGHVSMATAAAALVIATTTSTRQSRGTVLLWRLVGVGGVLVVAFDRWIMNAHWVSDIIGGWLWGAFAAITGLVLSGVRMLPDAVPLTAGVLPWRPPAKEPTGHLVCAVIHNPTKVLDMSTFRRHVEWELRQRGWYDAMWLSTTRDDAGVAMAQQAIEAAVDLVIVAGGDGTVRVVCSALANSGIPVAIVPAGTGNLLARNLGIPLDETAALDVAFDGVTEPIDLVRIEADDAEPTHFAVMAGLGIDARIMSATDARLKRTVGSAAYFIAAAGQISSPPVDLALAVDDRDPIRHEAYLALLANVGVLQANIQLVPDARPNDGIVDIVLANPRRLRNWARLTGEVLLRSRRFSNQVVELHGRRAEFHLAEPTPYELDGDTAGVTSHLVAQVDAGSLLIRLPRALPEPQDAPRDGHPGKAGRSTS